MSQNRLDIGQDRVTVDGLYSDTSKPLAPEDITIIQRKPVEGNDIDGDGMADDDILRKSTDYIMEKPVNWDEIKANTDSDKDIVFHMLMSTSQGKQMYSRTRSLRSRQSMAFIPNTEEYCIFHLRA